MYFLTSQSSSSAPIIEMNQNCNVPEHRTVILGSTTVLFQTCVQLVPTYSGQATFPSWRMYPATSPPISGSITHLAGDSSMKKRYNPLDIALYAGLPLYIETNL